MASSWRLLVAVCSVVAMLHPLRRGYPLRLCVQRYPRLAGPTTGRRVNSGWPLVHFGAAATIGSRPMALAHERRARARRSCWSTASDTAGATWDAGAATSWPPSATWWPSTCRASASRRRCRTEPPRRVAALADAVARHGRRARHRARRTSPATRSAAAVALELGAPRRGALGDGASRRSASGATAREATLRAALGDADARRRAPARRRDAASLAATGRAAARCSSRSSSAGPGACRRRRWSRDARPDGARARLRATPRDNGLPWTYPDDAPAVAADHDRLGRRTTGC